MACRKISDQLRAAACADVASSPASPPPPVQDFPFDTVARRKPSIAAMAFVVLSAFERPKNVTGSPKKSICNCPSLGRAVPSSKFDDVEALAENERMFNESPIVIAVVGDGCIHRPDPRAEHGGV